MRSNFLDPYELYDRVKSRLLDEYRKYGNRFIIAVDFDDTIYDTHANGWLYKHVFSTIDKWQKHAYIICWTASKEDRYPLIRDYFEKRSLRLDAINENAPWIEDRGRKIYANAYLDDRAGLSIILKALDEIYEEEIENG